MNSLSLYSDNRDFLSAYSGQNGKRILTYLGLSVLAHILFFGFMMLFYKFELPSPLPKVVQVDLVSFVPGPPGGQGTDIPETISEPVRTPEPDPPAAEEPVVVPEKPAVQTEAVPAEPVPEPVGVLKPDISLKKKPKNLKELMAEIKPVEKKSPKKEIKAKPDPKKRLERARQDMAKKVASQNKKQLADALARMQQAVGDKDKPEAGNGSGESVGTGAGNGTGLGRRGFNPIDFYKMQLKLAIEQNWVFNDLLARMDQDLEVRILIKILKSGEIRDITYETRSGNRYLDDSAKKAIQRANPLPGLPKGMASYDVVVIFTPKGLK